MVKFLVVALAGLALASAAPQAAHSASLTGQDLVDYVNSAGTFQAKLANKSYKKALMDIKYVGHSEETLAGAVDIVLADLPSSFDSRTQWPNCPSTKAIRDQSDCGSCWAVAAAEAITDRTCIGSQGTIQAPLSADDILSCCGFLCGQGCEGGFPLNAWEFWVHHGVVTGSNYTANAFCKPYPFPPCEHHVNATHFKPCPDDMYHTPKCEKKCQSSYPMEYSQDKHHGSKAYSLRHEQAMMTDLIQHGPIEASFEVYGDFEHYSGGIYKHTAGKLEGGHAVKIVGWGEENGQKYWIVANSWNTDWGENGFFRIAKGSNECGIESGAVGGVYKD